METVILLAGLTGVAIAVWLCSRPGWRIAENLSASRDGTIERTYSVWERKMYGDLIAHRVTKEVAEKVVRALEEESR